MILIPEQGERSGDVCYNHARYAYYSMIRVLRTPPQWAEPASFTLLGLTLLLRYPIHFIISPPFLMDFEVYRAAAERLLHGAGGALYAPTTSEMMVFKYAPIWAFLWMPFGWMSDHAAGVWWTATSVVTLLVTLRLCASLCRHHHIRYHPLTGIAAVLLLVRPLAEEMGNGQANLWWGCLTVAALHADASQRPWRSALAMAAAILLKLPALIFIPYLVLQREWRRLGRLAIALAGLILAGSWFVAPRDPFALVQAWMRALAVNGHAYAFIIGNQSVLACLGRFFTADGYGLNCVSLSRVAITWIAIGLGIAGLVFVGWPRRGAHSPQRALYDSALLMILMTVFSPTCWTATFMTLLFPLFLALAGLWHQQRDRCRDGWSLLWTGLVLLGSLFTNHNTWQRLHIPPWHGEAYLYLVFMVIPALTIALLALLARHRRLLDSPNQPHA